MEIRIKRIAQSRINEVDLNNVPFGKIFTDHMFTADYSDGEWKNFEIKPIENLSLHPSNLALHYGQSVFEGMKATVTNNGTPVLFRPEMHAKRINRSASRLCMPEFPEESFVKAVSTLVGLEHAWIPPKKGSAMYIRPYMFAMDAFLGVRPSHSYKFVILTLPVGPYYTKPVSLKADSFYVRAIEGGVGEAKAAGNYAAAMYPTQLANDEGFDQVMWLDGKEFKNVQEVGTMNIFFVIDGVLVTPATDGAILKGITRDSILTYMKGEGFPVEERVVTIDELVEAYKSGKLTEIFGSGTAAVVSKVHRLHYNGFNIDLDVEQYKIANHIYDAINSIRSGEKEDKYAWLKPVKVLEPA